MISYEVRGSVRIFDQAQSGKEELYQQFINASMMCITVPIREPLVEVSGLCL